jgi:hypothetical protein
VQFCQLPRRVPVPVCATCHCVCVTACSV